MPRPPARFVAQRAQWLIATAVAMIASGCITVPTDYPARGSRANVSPETRTVLQPGVTTLEDVLLLLGEPDAVSDDGRRIGYAWARVKAVVIIIGTGPGSGTEQIEKNYLLQISFDAEFCVKEATLSEHWGSPVHPEATLLPARGGAGGASREQGTLPPALGERRENREPCHQNREGIARAGQIPHRLNDASRATRRLGLRGLPRLRSRPPRCWR